ncbi:MAG: YbhB/YbcL family Raf kinase inhibitor-like protein [ANME-2 cluster archaeon]|nr:YbhB/YbcL family Raf kinase inhibitor-like protein [ANME-2 cluster archaeon]
MIILLLVLFSGCISDELEQKTQNKEETIMKNISISSAAFENGSTMPVEYTCDGADHSPALAWKGLPDGTRSITLIMDDPDAPGRTFVHWVIYNLPADSTELTTAVPRNKSLDDSSLQGKNDFGKIGYNGPCPPPGKPHRYFFKVYALDTVLDLKSGASKSQVEAAMSGHILAQGEMIGKFGR